jgi:hypothetical protein
MIEALTTFANVADLSEANDELVSLHAEPRGLGKTQRPARAR